MPQTTIIDILGRTGAAGSPAAVRGVAQQLGNVSMTAAQVRSQLQGAKPAHWHGEASNLFAAKQRDELPEELSKVVRSFDGASDALIGYASRLEAIQDDARALAQQRDVALDDVDAAYRRENAARAENARAQTLATSPEPGMRAAGNARLAASGREMTRAGAARSHATASLAAIDQRANDLRAALHIAGDAARRDLDAASHAGIRNTFGSWTGRRVVTPVAHATTDAVKAVGAFVAQSVDLLENATRFALDHSAENLDALAKSYSSWVESARPILDAVGIALLIATAIAVVVPGAQVALPFLIGASTGLSAVNFGLDSGKLESDTYLAARGKLGPNAQAILAEDGLRVGFDVMDVLIPGQLDEVVSGAGERSAISTLSKSAHANPLLVGELVDVTVKTAQTGRDVFLLDPAVNLVVHSFDALVPPLPPHIGGPIIGPFDALTQGPTSQFRVNLAPVPALVPACGP